MRVAMEDSSKVGEGVEDMKGGHPTGILRLDSGRPRRSAEFIFKTEGESTSLQSPVERYSVTFAEEPIVNYSAVQECHSQPNCGSMDKAHLPQPADVEDSDAEDYSASVNAIILRRASTRRSKRRRSTRRCSSPFSPDILPGTANSRRRSSVYTTSSGDTAITVDENLDPEVTQEEIFENIKLHKEVLSNVKMQPWNMRKKLKLVLQAKAYIKKHEGALQERLAQSHSTRDKLARYNIYLRKKWQHWRRELSNLSNWFIPWERKIKQIESHFGSVVASYFTFLRWLLWVNIVIAAVLVSFVAIPEMLTADPKAAGERKFILEEEKYNATNFLTLWDFQGVFKYSPLFYGWYTNNDSNMRGYRLPFAYFVTGLVVYAYSFFATLRKMAKNSRMSKLSEKDDECIFSWKLFTAWDYMIGNAETAHNRVGSIVLGFKEALLEEAEKKRESRNWKIIGFKILVNAAVLGLLSFSAFAVIMVVKRSTEDGANDTIWRKNEITVVMSLITLFFPMLFEVLGLLEQNHPRKHLRLQLARIMVLNLLNLYSLIFALFDKISDMTAELEGWKNKSSSTNTELILSTTTIPTLINPNCHDVCYFHEGKDDIITIPNFIQALMKNISTTAYPIVSKLITTIYQNISTTTQSTFDNVTIWDDSSTSTDANFFENITTFSDLTYVNNTYENIYSNFTDLTFGFVDYLTYILFASIGDNTTNIDIINSTDLSILNFTILNSSEEFTAKTYEYLSTISTPLPTQIDYVTDERFDFEVSTLYETITSTLSTVIENSTSLQSNCTLVCDDSTSTQTKDMLTSSSFPVMEKKFSYPQNAKLRDLCWETMFGQELIKLTIMDFIMTVLSTLGMDLIRGIFVRYMNNCWCWDLEKKFPQYGDFKVAENILHLVNNQGMVWMGMFFSPGLVVINVVKLYIMMYFRAWAVLTCNVPHEIIFRASRSNNFYYGLLLMMLFLCVLPVGYAIVWIKPSWHCGPFSNYQRIFHIFTKTIRNNVPEPLQKPLDYIASPGIIIPLLVLLILIIYYLLSLTASLRDANADLKIQLRRERTEERRKMFQLADRRRRSAEPGDLIPTVSSKWKKLIPVGKSFDDTPKQNSEDMPQLNEEKPEAKKDFFSFIKKALGKSSTSDEDQTIADDGTDTEQHESLPDDTCGPKEIIKPQVHKSLRLSLSSGSSEFPIFGHRRSSLKQHQTKLENLHNGSSDSSETKRVQILEKRGDSIDSCDAKRGRMREKKDQTPLMYRRDSFDLRNISCRIRNFESPSTSKLSRQDSNSSCWSDNIPVITISKTESSENILNEMSPKSKSKNAASSSTERDHKEDAKKSQPADETPKSAETTRFKPKIKYALKKQSTEIDEDMICYFGKDLEKITEGALFKPLPEDYSTSQAGPQVKTSKSQSRLDTMFLSKSDDNITDGSSSEDTDIKESSAETVVISPYPIRNKKRKDDSLIESNNSSDTQKSSQTESSSGYNDDTL